MKSLYEILGVNSDSGKDEIKKKYRDLAKKYHPDRMINASEKEKAEAEKKFREINDAYTILSDDGKRNEYDKMVESKNGYGKNKKSRSKNEKEDYGDIYEKFTKEGMNSMFGKFFDPEKKSSEKGDSKMKEQTNNMFESFFSFNGRKKK